MSKQTVASHPWRSETLEFGIKKVEKSSFHHEKIAKLTFPAVTKG